MTIAGQPFVNSWTINTVYPRTLWGGCNTREFRALGEIEGWYRIELTDFDKEDETKGLVERIWLITTRALLKVVIMPESLILTRFMRDNILSIEKQYTVQYAHGAYRKKLSSVKVHFAGLGEVVLENPVEWADYEGFAKFVDLL